MRVLLLHPEDRREGPWAAERWDLVVDLARAPISTYERWSGEFGCPVLGLYSFAREIEDLYYTRRLLALGLGRMVDASGVDWWDVLAPMVSSDLEELVLVNRLAQQLRQGSQIFTSRPNALARAVQTVVGGELTVFQTSRLAWARRRARHYKEVLAHLDAAQLAQVALDKFDSRHALRRRLAPRYRSSGSPLVLLPSAYINVSRAAVAYAAMLPEQQFLLAAARTSGALDRLPPNVRMTPLDSFFAPGSGREIHLLLDAWQRLRPHLVEAAREFQCAEAVGVLDRVKALLGWGVAVGGAWNRLFDAERIVACLCADDTNPYTRIPLILARQRRLPALACHHGAFDGRMAFKQQRADYYLAKGEMERDYLLRVCGVEPEKVVCGAAQLSLPLPQEGGNSRPWLAFFSEPYQSAAWRNDEVYRDLLPRLYALAGACGLTLVLKLHPFESAKQHRRHIARWLPPEARPRIQVISGPLSTGQWRKIRFALTVESTVAMECTCLGIPVFLCSWLRDAWVGYVPQYARFGVGQVLESPEDIARVPELLARYTIPPGLRDNLVTPISAALLQRMLGGAHPENRAATSAPALE